jgi:hypothetical protein
MPAPFCPAPETPLDPCASLIDKFRLIPDPRSPRGIRHPLPALLALCIIGLLSGAQNLTQIHRFAQANPEVLEALGNKRPKRWAPATATLSAVLGALRVSDLQNAVTEWFAEIFAQARVTVAAVDGKTSRASGVHVLNLFATDVQQTIWQADVDEKASEITVLRKILPELFEKYPFLMILTGDALFAGNPLCSEIIQRGRHYLFQVKGDQRQLHEKLELVFARHLNREPDPAALTGEKKGATR